MSTLIYKILLLVVDNKFCATPLPNRAVAFSVLNAVKPAIKKQGLDVKLSVEVLE